MNNTYRLTLRPASFCTLPRGIKWDYIEAPNKDIAAKRGLPVSQHPYGVIQTDRPLTADELESFDIVPV